MSEGEVLHGGIANAGAVLRIGDEVVRPSNPHSETIHSLLRYVRSRGFDGVPIPLRIGADGREWLSYIPGEVPIPPFPLWSEADTALASTAGLIRRFHDASVGFVPPEGGSWNMELADGDGGQVICHNDVCPENVVFRDGEACALLDFDFIAPGRRAFDLASFASMSIPLDTPEDAARSGMSGLEPHRRLRLVADAYGLPPDRRELIDLITERFAQVGAFVESRVEAGIQSFVDMWNAMGGKERYERRRLWFESERERFLDEVG